MESSKRVPPLSLVVLVAALGLVTALGACRHAGPLTLRPPDSGKAVEMTVGQTVTVRLPVTLSTGYTWQVAKEPDARVLLVIDSGYDEPRSAPPGAPGEAWWKLRATAAGSTDLALRYLRPWEPDKIAKEFTLTVVVK